MTSFLHIEGAFHGNSNFKFEIQISIFAMSVIPHIFQLIKHVITHGTYENES